jgi:hypothetical protein
MQGHSQHISLVQGIIMLHTYHRSMSGFGVVGIRGRVSQCGLCSGLDYLATIGRRSRSVDDRVASLEFAMARAGALS